MELSKVIVVEERRDLYGGSISSTPGAVAANSPLFSLMNPAVGGNDKGIHLLRIFLNLVFFGTAANSIVAYGIRRYTHATGYTGGLGLSPGKMRSSSPSSGAVVRSASTGVLTDPGVVLGADFFSIANANQLPSNASMDLDISNSPLVLMPGEGIVLYSITAVLASTTVDGSMLWQG